MKIKQTFVYDSQAKEEKIFLQEIMNITSSTIFIVLVALNRKTHSFRVEEMLVNMSPSQKRGTMILRARGKRCLWQNSICQHMVSHLGPRAQDLHKTKPAKIPAWMKRGS